MTEISAVPDAEQSQSSLDLTEAVDLLLEVVIQACSSRDCPHDDEYLDSMALSAYADALRYLEKKGKVRIDSEGGQRVIAYSSTGNTEGESMTECILTNESIAASSEMPSFKGKCHVCCQETELKGTWYGVYCSSCHRISGPDCTYGMVARMRREYLGLTRKELGVILGLKTSMLRRYEHGVFPEAHFKKLEELICQSKKNKIQK